MTLTEDHEGIHRPSDVVLLFRLLAKENKLQCTDVHEGGIQRPSDVVLLFRLLAKENKLLKIMKAASKGHHMWSFSFSLACR